MARQQPTIHDVAQLAGVSIATVSRATSGGKIAPQTKLKVEKAIRTLGYQPTSSRLSMYSQRSSTIAVVLSSQTIPYYAQLCAGLTKEANRCGYKVLVCNYSDKTPIATVVNDLIGMQPAGALIAGFMVEEGPQAQIQAALLRLQEAMPLVVIGPPLEGFHCTRLTSDPSMCVRKSLAHLAMLGHQQIAYVGGYPGTRSYALRLAAYKEELTQHGIQVKPAYIIASGDNAPAGELAASILMDPARKDHPTAFLAYSDIVALGLLGQLYRMGIRVPEDVAVVGCGNEFFSAHLSPALTTIDLRPFDHGRMAMSELILSIQGHTPILSSQPCECQLIVRDSCGAAAANLIRK